MLTLSINDFTLSPAPAVDVRIAAADHHGTPALKETWTLKGTLNAASPEQLAELRDAFEAALHDDALELTLANGSDTLRSLDPSDPLTPSRCVDLKYDAHDPARLHTSLAFTARVEATIAAPWSADQAPAETRTTFGTSAAGLATITTELAAPIPPGTSEQDALALLAIALRPGMRRTESRIVIRTDNTTTHRAIDEEIATALPTGVTDGHVSTTMLRASDGRMRQVIEGHFTGVNAAARARELRPTAQPLLAESVTENPFTRRVDFRYETLANDGLNTLIHGQSESISFTERRRIIELALLSPTAPPHRQEIGPPRMEIVQRGEATGTRQHPEPAPPLHPADVVEREVEYSPLGPQGSRRTPPVTRWKYVMRPEESTIVRPA